MVGPALEAVQGKEEGDYTSVHCIYSGTYLRKSKSVPFDAADRRINATAGKGRGKERY